MIQLPQKDPASILDFELDFADDLGTDTPSGSPTIVAVGVTFQPSPAPSWTGTKLTFWLSGGTAGQWGTVTITFNTTNGRKVESSATVYVDDL